MRLHDDISFLHDSPRHSEKAPDDFISHIRVILKKYFIIPLYRRKESSILFELPYLNNSYRKNRHVDDDIYAFHSVLIVQEHNHVTIRLGLGRTLFIQNNTIRAFLPYEKTRWDYSHFVDVAYFLNQPRPCPLRLAPASEIRSFNNSSFLKFASFSAHTYTNESLRQFSSIEDKINFILHGNPEKFFFHSVNDRLNYIRLSSTLSPVFEEPFLKIPFI